MKGEKNEKKIEKLTEKKQIANRKRYIYNKFVRLYEQYVFNQKWEYCCDLVAMMKKEFGSDYLRSEIFIEDNEPYIITTINDKGNFYKIKVSK